MSEQSRRFTDREVALVLKKASEIDEALGEGAASGLSLEDLTDIAREVGISPSAIQRAVAGLDRAPKMEASLTGAPLVRKAAHAIPEVLSDEAIASLIRVIDERTDNAGTVSEALGSVRWTGSDRFRSTNVSITRSEDETSIVVVEKAAPRLRRVFHLVAPAWAVMLAMPSLGALQWSPVGTAAGFALVVAAGAGVGRTAWNLLSVRSARRVRELAEALAAEGHAAARAGLPPTASTEVDGDAADQ